MSGHGLLAADAESSVPAGAVPLFAGIDADELERVEHFMAPFRAAAGEVLFRQGEDGDRCSRSAPDRSRCTPSWPAAGRDRLATLRAGESLGEMAVLGGARRAGHGRCASPRRGWLLHRSSLAMLRLDPAPGAVELVARHDRARARPACASVTKRSLQDMAPNDRPTGRAPRTRATTGARPRPAHLSGPYLETLLCFRHFHDHGQIERALGGAEAVELPAGAVALAPGAAPA